MRRLILSGLILLMLAWFTPRAYATFEAESTGGAAGVPGANNTFWCTNSSGVLGWCSSTNFLDTTLFENAADPTKQVQFDLSGIATGTKSTLKFPIVERIGVVFDGGGSALAAGKTVYMQIPFAVTAITNWTVLCDQNNAGTVANLIIDVWDLAYSPDTLPTVSNTMCGSGTLPNVAYGAHKTGTGAWNCTGTSIAAGDMLGFNLKTVPTGNASTWCSATLWVTR